MKHTLENNKKLNEIYSKNAEFFRKSLLIALMLPTSIDITQHFIDILCKEKYEKLKKLVIQAEPPIDLRWMVWKALASHSRILAEDEFHRVADAELSSRTSQTLIRNDVERTFCDKAFYSKKIEGREVGKEKLRKVCTAVDVYFKRIRYTQGMSLILGLILKVSGGNEVETFNFYLHFMKARKLQFYSIMDDLFTFNLFLSYFFKEKLKKVNPRLAKQIDMLEFPDDCWIGKWWISIFAGYFHEYLVVRIIDYLLVTNLVHIVDVALAISSLLSDRLIKSDLIDFNMILKEASDQPEILDVHPNTIIALATTFTSSGREILEAMNKFLSLDSTSKEVYVRMAAIIHQYEDYLLADEDRHPQLGHEDVSLSVFSIKDCRGVEKEKLTN